MITVFPQYSAIWQNWRTDKSELFDAGWSVFFFINWLWSAKIRQFRLLVLISYFFFPIRESIPSHISQSQKPSPLRYGSFWICKLPVLIRRCHTSLKYYIVFLRNSFSPVDCTESQVRDPVKQYRFVVSSDSKIGSRCR